ncbi:MAG: M20/M25/M40 family metallo-hydrolase [Desulfobacterales bacterium]|nr:M20/M25/M40 family metallo-hydrolase [Desulfobacterales bacterium]
MPINQERLARTFKALVRCDSVSRAEGRFAALLQEHLQALGVTTRFDRSAARTGSDTGNLVGYRAGRIPNKPLLFSAHMDTVVPGRGIHPVLRNGCFTSAGDTILGADDKSAIAILLEVLAVLKAAEEPFAPIELVFSTCEEIGLLGAKHLDFGMVSAEMGYVLDARDPDRLINRSPSANRLHLKVHGKEAHAGASPEKGINAIFIASRAIAALQWGRLDRETTRNIGTLRGGEATNIVPSLVHIEAEVRSHDEDKLVRATREIVSTFQATVDAVTPNPFNGSTPRLEASVTPDFKRTHIPDDHPVVELAAGAGRSLGRRIRTQAAGGGSDANIFFQKGIATGVLGTGMQDVHTRDERIALDDMVKACELVLEIIRRYSGTA